MLRSLFYLIAILLVCSCHRTEEVSFDAVDAPYMQVDVQWADSILQTMTVDEKIAQLLVVDSDGRKEGQADLLIRLAGEGHLGGVILSNYSVEEYLLLLDQLQNESPITLLNGTHEAAALNNKFTDTPAFPLPATLGAIKSDSIHQRLLDLYVRQISMLGVNFCFAPSVSIVDADATSYDFNSFEHNAEELVYRSTRSMQAIQDANVLAIGNAFKDLRYFDWSEKQIQDSILQKYKNLVANGLSGLLLDSTVCKQKKDRFYAHNYLKRYLQKNLAFDGLSFAELADSQSIVALMQAGVDVFVIKDMPGYYVEQVKEALLNEDIAIKAIDQRVRKVLMAKTWLGIHKQKPSLDIQYAIDQMSNKDFDYYAHRLYESALLLPNNPTDLIPFKNTSRHYFKIVEVNEKPFDDFKKSFSKYAQYNVYGYPFQRDSFELLPLAARHLKTSTVVILLDQINLDAERDKAFINSINHLTSSAKLVVVNFGNPINLKHFNADITSLQLFERNATTESMAAQLLFGGMEAKGHLPIALADHLPYGANNPAAVTRLKYTLPQEVGIDTKQLEKIDELVQGAIRKKAMPGAQVMIVKDGKVFYDKNFGYHTYERQQPVQSNDLYDLASVSKVVGTTLMSMKLYEAGKFQLKNSIADYLIGKKRPRVRRVSVRELFTHRSGLQSYMPIAAYLNNRDRVEDGCNQYFCEHMNGDYTIPIADGIFFNKSWVPVIEQKIHNLRVKRRGRYLYSDVNFNLLKQMNENIANKPMDVFLDQQLFRPLNLKTIGYRPLRRFSKSSIVPTAHDRRWRKQLIRGYVHDESAALLGGVGGNAGLFSNANDLGVLFQVLLNKGTYGGQQIFSAETVREFTRSRYNRRRALGFEIKTKRGTGSCSPYASSKTFGHKGYTGTCVWADPESGLTFIFLTNRIYPNPKNNRLKRYKVRQRIHSVVYKSLDTYRETIHPDGDLPVAVARME